MRANQIAQRYSLMGREKEAQEEAAEVLRIDPSFLSNIMQKHPSSRIKLIWIAILVPCAKRG